MKWVMVALSIQTFAMGCTISKLCYDLGFERGRASVYQEFAQDSSDGYCLADKPAHEGECHDSSPKVIKRSK
jgi:hypothetical protein